MRVAIKKLKMVAEDKTPAAFPAMVEYYKKKLGQPIKIENIMGGTWEVTVLSQKGDIVLGSFILTVYPTNFIDEATSQRIHFPTYGRGCFAEDTQLARSLETAVKYLISKKIVKSVRKGA